MRVSGLVEIVGMGVVEATRIVSLSITGTLAVTCGASFEAPSLDAGLVEAGFLAAG